jgi:hypothetical protein
MKKIHNKGLHNLHSSLDIIRMNKLRSVRWAGHVARTKEMRMHINFLSQDLKENTWENNIKTDLKEIGCEGVD